MTGPTTPYNWKTINVGSVRPSTTYGTAVTIGASNAKGSAAQLFSALSDDAHYLNLFLHAGDIPAAAGTQLIDLMVDPAGGSSYTTVINNLFYQAATQMTNGGGAQYQFPLFIKAGSSIGIRGQRSTASTVTTYAALSLAGRPNDAANSPVGSRVVTYGANTSTTTGVAVTSGTTSEGAWTLLGTVASGDYPWFWQVAAGTAATAAGSVLYGFDLAIGDATNKVVVITDSMLSVSTAEQGNAMQTFETGYFQARPGDNIYGRMQCSGTPDSSLSMIAYGVI